MIKIKEKEVSMKMISSSLFAFCSPFFAHWMREESLTNHLKHFPLQRETLATASRKKMKKRKKKRMFLAHSLHEELKATK